MKSLPAVKTPQWPAAEFPPLFNPKWLVAAFILKIPNQISSASLQSNKEISSTDSFLSNQAIHRRFQPSRSENKNVPKTRFKQIFMNFAVNDADNRHSRHLLKEISLWSLLYFCPLSPPITPQVLYDTFPVVCRRNVPIIKLQHLWRNTFHGPWRPHELHSLSSFSCFYSFGITVWWILALMDERRGHVQDKKVYFSLFKWSLRATGT